MKPLIAAAALFVLAGTAAAQEVRVTLTGVEARPGDILASLQTEQQFMQPAGSYGQIAQPVAGTVTIVFPDVAPGSYSLAVMHDENRDRQMQREDDGRPKEGWAMVNGASLSGRPTFAQVKFDVGATPVHLTAAMVYPPRQ
jgi:uncharacterized protein (DUF2141 family)